MLDAFSTKLLFVCKALWLSMGRFASSVPCIKPGLHGIRTIARMDTIPKDTILKDTFPNGRYLKWTQSRMNTIPNGHYPEWTPSRMDTISNGHHPEWTQSRMDTIPNGHLPSY